MAFVAVFCLFAIEIYGSVRLKNLGFSIFHLSSIASRFVICMGVSIEGAKKKLDYKI